MRSRLHHTLPILLLASGCNEFEITTIDITELFKQSEFEKVDVLIVVDNSGSMAPYQAKLGRDFPGFFDYFGEAEVDWQLGVTHTDARAEDFGELRGPIVTSESVDPAGLFAEVVNVGAEGGGIEAGLAAASKLIEKQRDGFPREDASLSVIFVSDEEDASPLPVADYINNYFSLRGQRHREAFAASALTVTELAACTPEQFEGSSRGTRYVETARVTGGISANLCSDDLQQIALDLALTTSSQLTTFYLRERPALNTLQVRIDGEQSACEDGRWTYQLVDRDAAQVPAIVFNLDALPSPGAEVLVEYARGQGDPSDFCPTDGA